MKKNGKSDRHWHSETAKSNLIDFFMWNTSLGVPIPTYVLKLMEVLICSLQPSADFARKATHFPLSIHFSFNSLSHNSTTLSTEPHSLPASNLEHCAGCTVENKCLHITITMLFL